MKLIILRTNIKSHKKVKTIQPVFDNHAAIKKWTIDLDDVDKVLRIEASENLQENEIMKLIQAQGFFCEELMN